MRETDKSRTELAQEVASLKKRLRDLENEKNQFEEIIHGRENQFQRLLSSTKDIVWSAKLDGEFIYFNEALEKVYGRSVEEFMANPAIWSEVVHPDDREWVKKESDQLIDRGNIEIEYRILRPNGEVRWLFDRKYVVFDDDGNPLRLGGIASDITKRKIAEFELAHQSAFLESIYYGVDLPVFIVDIDSEQRLRFAGVNPAHEKLTGLKAANIIGKSIDQLSPAIPRKTIQEIKERYKRRLDEGKTIHYEEMITISGKETWWLTTLTPLKDDAGAFFRIVGTSISITERIQMEEELRNHRDHLEELVTERTADLEKSYRQLEKQIKKQLEIEAELRESEQKYRNLFNNAQVGMYRSKIDGSGIIDVNKKLIEIFEYSRDELISNPVLRIWKNPEERKEMLQVLKREGKLYNYEIEIIAKSGKHKVILDSMRLYPELGYIEGSAIDITDRKQMEKELHLRNFAIKSANAGIAVTDLEGKLTYVNPAFLGLFKYEKASDVLGGKAADFTESKEKTLETIQHVQTTGNWTGELGMIRQDGSKFFAQVAASVVLDSHKNSIGMMASFIDVTERKYAEEIIKLEKKFSESIINSLPSVFYMFDKNGVFFKWNTNLESVTGYTREEIGQLNPIELFDEEEKQKVADKIKAVFKYGEATVEAKFLTKKGSKIPYYFTGARFIENEKAFLIGAGIDITIRKRAEEDMKRYLEALKRSNAELEQFAYVASHDLQEPLRSISGYLQLLERKYIDDLDEKARNFIRRSTSAALRMQSLIQSLLSFSRVTTRGKDFENINCNHIIEYVKRSLKSTIEDNDVEIISDHLPVVEADPNQLEMVFQNLISNAVKFRSEALPKIRIGAEDMEKDWKFSIADNGIGIERQYFDRIFTIFQRLHTIDEYEGTGIGLSLAKKIIERHGGRIWLESEPGKGSVFYFTIPKRKVLND